jgi:hypothetical protein
VPEFIPRLTRLHVHGILRAFDEQLDIAIAQRRRSLSEKGPPLRISWEPCSRQRTPTPAAP